MGWLTTLRELGAIWTCVVHSGLYFITGLLVRDIYGRGVVPDWRSANTSTHSAWTTVSCRVQSLTTEIAADYSVSPYYTRLNSRPSHIRIYSSQGILTLLNSTYLEDFET